MSIAIYPGSFDPVTTGHVNLIERASKIFDHVIVCVLINSGKKTPLFSIDERVNMLEYVTEGFHNVSVKYYDGLLVDFAKQEEANIIVRGLREMSDFDAELQMAQGNKAASDGTLETVFLPTDPNYSFVSSTMIREFANYHHICREFVPDIVADRLEEKVKSK